MAGLADLLAAGDPEAASAAAASQAIAPAVGSYLANVLSGRMAAQAAPQDYYDPNRSFAQNALDPRALDQAVNIALGFSGGGLGTKARAAAASDLPAPNIGMGTAAPLFDLSNLTTPPNVPQTPIARMPPKTTIPGWAVDQINDPARINQYRQVLQLGRDTAGDQNALGWWNTFPLRERYIGEMGEAAGDPAWRSDMNLISATSPRTPFPENVRQFSYFGNLLAEGQPLPELVKKYQKGDSGAYNMVPTSSAPPGYKNFPQHIMNIQNLLNPDQLTLNNAYPLSNPKAASMAQNLVGNWSVPTIDVRDLRAMGMQYKNGKAMEAVDPTSLYGYMEENFHQPLAAQLSKEQGIPITPAQMQSTTWVGVPEYFGGFDRSGQGAALNTIEDSIRRTAAARGLTPEQTLVRGFMRKEFPLLGLGALGVGALSQGVDPNQRPAFQ